MIVFVISVGNYILLIDCVILFMIEGNRGCYLKIQS